MVELERDVLTSVAGAALVDNTQIAKDFATNVAWGAGLGAFGGPVSAGVGAVGGAVQTVVQGAINHGPVNVPIPGVPMSPSWVDQQVYSIYGTSSLDELLKHFGPLK